MVAANAVSEVPEARVHIEIVMINLLDARIDVPVQGGILGDFGRCKIRNSTDSPDLVLCLD